MKKLRAGRLCFTFWTAITLAGCGSDDGGEPDDPLNLEEFQVNTTPLGQDNRTISQRAAVGPDGRFMVGWTIHDPSRIDRVLAQFIDANGNKLGAESNVSDSGVDAYVAARSPFIGLKPGGEATLAFLGLVDCCQFTILARRIRSNGTPIGAASRVAVASVENGVDPPVLAFSSTGESLVVWSTESNFNWTIRGQRLAADGSPVDGEQVFGTILLRGGSPAPRADMLPDGSYLLSWNTGAGRHAQRYNASGSKIGPELMLSVDGYAETAVVPNGQMIALRQNAFPDLRLLVQRFASDGTKLGGEIQVGDPGLAAGGELSVAPDGRFAVTWEQIPPGGNTFEEIWAQRFAADGSQLGPAFKVNATPQAQPYEPSIAIAPSGHVLVTWVENASHTLRGRLFAE